MVLGPNAQGRVVLPNQGDYKNDDPTEPVLVTDAATNRNLRRLRGHVPLAARRALDKGKLDDTQELPVTMVLELNNRSELVRKVIEFYRPGSSDYHRFMTPEEFRQRYYPSQEQMAKVHAFLKEKGLQKLNASETAPSLLVRAKGSTKHLNSAFRTELRRYMDKDGRAHFAPAYEIQVPDELPIRSVHGLHDFTRLRPHSSEAPAASSRRSGSGANGGFSPADIRLAYNIPTASKGAGQTLALFELDGYDASDVKAYEKQFGLPGVPLENILLDGVTGSVGQGGSEVTLDIELMEAMAPDAAKILVYEAPNTDQGILDALSRIANENRAKSISTSWGAAELETSPTFLESENAIFLQMAAQGQTFYAAAGDFGAYDDGTNLTVDDPASQPYVVAVGGTSLATNSTGHYGSETTWNGGAPTAGAGGGGISLAWSLPSWQYGLATKANGASSARRNVPDVSLNADPATGYAIYYSGGWHVYGGTSCAAPLWAAFNGLVNEQRALGGLPPIGYINPILYDVAQSSAYAQNFFDISDNSTNLYYAAVTGFDNATGWGSFNGGNLLKTLAAEPTSSAVSNSSFVGVYECR